MTSSKQRPTGLRLPDLPINAVLDDIGSALGAKPNLVLVAPPGSGKTTIVPLVLLEAPWREGRRILVLEPRRLAARAAAHRMANLLGEAVGKRVGYRVRFDAKISSETVIEVVTEGVFSRMLAEDSGLDDVAAVLFDEFHERSLDGDLALALCLDLQSALRPDLRLIPMSATLDGARVAELIDASVIEAEGRTFPVEISYRERSPGTPIENAAVQAVLEQVSEPDSGSLLVFLPGMREIERVAEGLEGRLPGGVELHRLYGALGQQAQDAAIRPAKDSTKKVVLASAIAETSLTIEGVTTVIDSGLSRQPVFEPMTGLTRLQTVRASQASIEQRAGRAGRLGPGKAVRLWRKEQTAALPKFAPPEILNADLSGLALDLADWGVSDVSQLKWIDPPPAPALAEARKLLGEMNAITTDGQLTRHGKIMRSAPLPPRLAHMVVKAAEISMQATKNAALLALLVQERGVGGRSEDLGERLERAKTAKDNRTKTILKMADRLAERTKPAPGDDEVGAGVLLGYAFADRIAQNTGSMPSGVTRFRLANGRGAEISGVTALARESFLVVVDMAGRAGAARILSAAAISKADLLAGFADVIEDRVETVFNAKTGQLTATRQQKLWALTLSKPQPVAVDPDAARTALLDAVRTEGIGLLPWRPDDEALRGRLGILHKVLGDPWPGMDDASLLAALDEWVLPFLKDPPALADLKSGALSDGLMLLAGHPSKQQMDELLPTHFTTPGGSRVPIRYDRDTDRAVLSVRPQELFGLDQHPSVLNGQLPVDLELLSPAGRPIQITRDLPVFWRGSWRDVRADLRGRYPKHPWPEDPVTAIATSRAKQRKRS